MKRLLKIVIAIVIVLVIAVAIVFWRIDQIAAAAIERGGTYAMGVQTKVDAADVALFGGRLEVSGLNIANPRGYSEASMLDSGLIAVAVKTGSLRSQRVVIPELRIENLDLKLERADGRYNLQVIADNLEKLGSGERDPDQPKPETKQKYVVEKIVIRNVTGSVELPVGDPLEIEIPEIVIENLTDENARGVVLHELIARIFPAIMAGVVNNVGDLPGELKKVMIQDLAGAASKFGDQAVEALKQAVPDMEGPIGDVLDNVREGVGERAGEAIEGAGDRVREGLEGLMPGGNREDEGGN